EHDQSATLAYDIEPGLKRLAASRRFEEHVRAAPSGKVADGRLQLRIAGMEGEVRAELQAEGALFRAGIDEDQLARGSEPRSLQHAHADRSGSRDDDDILELYIGPLHPMDGVGQRLGIAGRLVGQTG